MIIEIKKSGKVTAESETLQEGRTLLSLSKWWTNDTKKVEKTLKEVKIYKKGCPKCGKRVKYMESHNTVMHGEGRLLGAVRGDLAKVITPSA